MHLKFTLESHSQKEQNTVHSRGNHPAWLQHSCFIFFLKLFYNPDNRGSGLTGHRMLPGTMVSRPEKNPFCSIGHLHPFKAARDLQLWLLSEGLPVASMMKTVPLVCRLPVHIQIRYWLNLFTLLIKAPCPLLLPDVMIKISTFCLSDAG